MTDLFGYSPTAKKTEPAANPRLPWVASPQVTHGTHGSRRPPANPGGPTAGRVSMDNRVTRAAHGNVQNNRRPGDGESQRLLRTEMATLEAELGMALRAARDADEAVHPFELAFKAAHEDLDWLLKQHGPGPRTDEALRAKILAAYDKRWRASHAAHPYREAAKTADRMVKAIRERLAEVKEELA